MKMHLIKDGLNSQTPHEGAPLVGELVQNFETTKHGIAQIVSSC